MIEGKSPEKKATQLPDLGKPLHQKLFAKILVKGWKLICVSNQPKKELARNISKRETAKFDKYYKVFSSRYLKKFKPAPKAFREKILKQAKDRGIPDISVVKGSRICHCKSLLCGSK